MYFDWDKYKSDMSDLSDYVLSMATGFDSVIVRQVNWNDSILIDLPVSAFEAFTNKSKTLTGVLLVNILGGIFLTFFSLIVCPVLLLLNIIVRAILILIPLPFCLFFIFTNNVKFGKVASLT